MAQVIADGEHWARTLAATHRAVRQRGWVAFESRNPGTREWVAWTAQASRRQLHHPALGQVEVWQQVLEVQGDRVSSEIHYRFASDGTELVSTNELRFRTRGELRRSLTDAGFSVEQVLVTGTVGPSGWEAQR